MMDLRNQRVSDVIESPEAILGEMIKRAQLAIRLYKPDKEQTVDLVMRAMGSRSRRQFAEDLGVNVSSVSRILKGQVNEISPQIIAKIAFYAAPESDVTLEQLMEAQGMIDPKDRAVEISRYEDKCRRILVDALLKSGYSVKYEPNTRSDEVRLRIISDFKLRTDALGTDNSLWMMECKIFSQNSILPQGTGRSSIWMDTAMAYYYRGGKASRISIVVNAHELFEFMKHRLEELTIPNEISVILVSTKEGRVIDEYIAPLTDGRVAKRVFGTDEAGGEETK